MDKDIVFYGTCSYSAFEKAIHAAFWCADVGGLIQGKNELHVLNVLSCEQA